MLLVTNNNYILNIEMYRLDYVWSILSTKIPEEPGKYTVGTMVL